MALSTEQKAEIIAMHHSGMQPQQIVATAVERFGCPAIAVRGLLNQAKWKADPSSRPKTGRPKKVEEIIKKTSFEEPEMMPMQQSPLPGGMPLFSGLPGVADRIEVIRVHATPRHAGLGVVGEIDPAAQASDLQSIYGGGRYQLKAYDANGRLLQSRSIVLAGRSIPVDPEYADAGPGAFYMPDQSGGPLAGLVAQLQQQIIAMSTREREDDRLTFEQRLQLERERAKNDNESRMAGMREMMAFQAQAHSQQLQMVIAANQKGGSQETLTLLKTAKDLFGDGGGQETDAVTELAKNAPSILGGLQSFMQARGLGAAPPAATGAALPAPTQPGPTMEVQQAGMVLVQELMKQGLSQEEAIAEVQAAAAQMEKRVLQRKERQEAAKRQAAKIQQQRTVVQQPTVAQTAQPPAPTVPQNGMAQPAQGVPPQVPPAAPGVEVKA